MKDKSPYKIIICFVHKDKEDVVRGILKNAKEPFYVSFLGEGVSIDKGGMLGGDRQDVSVFAGFVRADNATRTLQGLDLVLCTDAENSFGLAFTTEVTSITREMLEYFLGKQKEGV